MIGTFIRGSHHLKKSGGYLTPIKIMGIRNHNIISGTIIVGKDNKGRDIYFFFQNINNNIDIHKVASYCDNDTYKVVSNFMKDNPRCVMLFDFRELRNYGTQFIMLPSDFENIYNSFIQQNRKLVEPLFKKYIMREDCIAKLLFAFCESGNYFSWAVKCVKMQRISPMTIYRLMVWQNTYSQLVSKLSKGTMTAYNNYSNLVSLLSECQVLRQAKRANDIINMFNTEQKKLLKNNFDKLPKELLSKFAILSKVKQQNFIRKVSTITELDEIIRLLEFTTSSHFKWEKNSLLDYIKNVEGLKCEIVLENETSVLVKVEDYETIKKLAKTTNWCISKNKSYWNNYMKKSGCTQYVLFDFSKKEDDELSIVGFTTSENKGIIHAHSFTNANLMDGNYNNEQDAPYENIVQNINTRKGIHAVIANNGIPLSLITQFRTIFPKWSKEGFFEVFNKYATPEEYTIYFDENDKMVISLRNYNVIGNMFGNKYYNKFSDYYSNNEHILFLDFSKTATDNEKLIYSIVITNEFSKTSSTTIGLYNEFGIKIETSFNTMIDNWGLPYTIICRPNSISNRFKEAISSHSLEEIKLCLKDDKIKSVITSKTNSDIKNMFKNELYSSLSSYNSLDLVNALNEVGININDVLSLHEVRLLFENFYVVACGFNPNSLFKGNFDEDKYVNLLLSKTLDGLNQTQKVFIANYYLAKLMIKPYLNDEKSIKFILHNFIKDISQYGYIPHLGDYICEIIMNNIDFTSVSTLHINFINFVINNKIKSCIDKLKEIDIDNEILRNLIIMKSDSKLASFFRSKWGIKEEKKENVKESIKASVINYSYIPFDFTWDVSTTN